VGVSDVKIQRREEQTDTGAGAVCVGMHGRFPTTGGRIVRGWYEQEAAQQTVLQRKKGGDHLGSASRRLGTSRSLLPMRVVYGAEEGAKTNASTGGSITTGDRKATVGPPNSSAGEVWQSVWE